MKRRLFSILVLTFLIGLTIDLAISVAANTSTPVPEDGSFMEEAVINVANLTGKAVVSISTERTEKIKGRRLYYNQPYGSPFGEDENFRKFFDDFFGAIPDREYKKTGLGSGVIINNDGFILTNEHVIDDADKVTVTLSDGREFSGQIKGRDSRSDLAVIKIDAHNLPVARLGDSDKVRIGQWVVAIGNPYSFAMQNPEPTVTAGVISALHRSLGRTLAQDRDYGDLIQTDAAINPGNSGGPLVDLKGQVIGINVAIFSTTGGYQGIGFAIPINTAKRIISRLIEGKKIVYGWLGITVQDLNEDLIQHFGLPDKNGVLTAKVLEDNPAKKAGMKEGDIIKFVDSIAINNVRELLSVVGKFEVGRHVKVSILRDKRPLILDIVIGERPQAVQVEEQPTVPETGKWRGLAIENITPEVSRRFQIEEKSGVVVVDVEPNSEAADAGLIPGDVILEINKKPVGNALDYEKATKASKGNVLVRTSRGFFIVKESSEKK